MRRIMGAAAVCLLAWALVGCSGARGSGAPSATEAVERYVRAVASGDAEAARSVSAMRLSAGDMTRIRLSLFFDEETFRAETIDTWFSGEMLSTPGGPRGLVQIDTVVDDAGGVRLESEDTYPEEVAVLQADDGTWLVEAVIDSQDR